MPEEHFGLQLQVLFCDSLPAHGFFILKISSLCNKNFILEIHVVYRIVPGCGNLAKIDFPPGHFRTQLAYRIFAQALALIWYSPFLLCACCEGGVYSTNAECPVLVLVVPWPHYRPESKMIDAYLLSNTYLIILLWKMHAALWLCNVYYIIVTSM